MSLVETPASRNQGTKPGPAEQKPVRDLATRFRSSLQQLLAFGSLIVLVIFFGAMNSRFLVPSNLSDILLSTVVIGLLALGATFVIITGGIDLSVGTGMSLCSVMTGVVLTYLGLPLWAGVIGGILMGAVIGAVNGFLISFLKIPPFIATLATMLVAQGMALVVSGTKPIYFTSTEGFANLALGKPIPGLVVPNAVFIFFAVAVLAGLVMSKTLLGRYTFSIGSNEEATALSGINVRNWKLWIYTAAGAFTGLAGVIIAARLNSAQPGQGMGYELQAIAAVVIGGTSLAGGKGSIVGTVIGALIMSVLTNGLRIISVPQEWQNVAIGVVILVAVYLDMLRRKETTK
ncbi:ribose ABC transporter permease [Arthrobacter sp. StoSoilA2]|jgi:ribose transport system permease protein|uniref:ABC transporter permease n=1 Tax=unclassified Arthrobacter TaxID=235627 RepID=UPI001CC3DF1E|nr:MULTISPECIES: ABC transporter permease [unclassified Arthrobacter]MDR6686233.1 ribose transport system permease protein [Arthrobacter sp. 1088]BCW38019.1 ribose ABC transporter permease [Arthrobacter sp. StoSoilA2]